MGKILKALSPPSSYAAKKTNLWDELMSAIGECVTAQDVEQLKSHIEAIDHEIPKSWIDPLNEIIEDRIREIEIEDQHQSLRARW